MKELTDETWDVGGEALLVECVSEWCGPCRKMEPVMAALEAWWAGRVEVAKADLGRCRRSLGALGVRSVPTMVLFVGGAEAGRWVGLMKEGQLRFAVEAKLVERGL